MHFEKVLEKLEQLLKQPLPGRMGQVTMSPQPVDESRFQKLIRDDHRKGAVLMLFYPGKNQQTFVPFIKRPTYAGVHSGQIAFPGGKMDLEDTDLSITALRETEEEIGVDRNQITLLGKLTDLYIPPSNFMVSPYLGYVENVPKFKPDPKEVDRIILSPLEHILQKDTRKQGLVQGSGGFRMNAPYFDIESEMVWGATAMMLGEFTYLWENTDF